MKPVICPCVTTPTNDPHVFREQIERVSFAPRVHIDLMDGIFAPHKNLNPIQIWWPDNVLADIHVMYEHPGEHLETLISLNPRMVILHVESVGDIEAYLRHIKRFGIKTGVALLADTSVAEAHGCIEVADHVMLFSGTLGSFGGKADLEMLKKIPEIQAVKPDIEIGWDGGVNMETIRSLSEGGVNVLNVGGAIQRSPNPERSYGELLALL